MVVVRELVSWFDSPGDGKEVAERTFNGTEKDKRFEVGVDTATESTEFGG